MNLAGEHVRNNIAKLKGLILRRNRNTRRGVVVKTFHRGWWGTGLKRRRRRSRRMFSGIFGRKRWRLERRDRLSMKRTRCRYNMLADTLQSTAVAKRALLTRELTFSRGRFAAMQSQKLNTNLAASAGLLASLRSSLRHLVRRQRVLTRSQPTPRRVSRRLDTRARRLSAANKGTHYRVLSLPAGAPSRLLPAVERGKTLVERLSHQPKQTVTRRYRR